MQIKRTLGRIVISRRPIVGIVDVDVLLIKTTHVLIPRPPVTTTTPSFTWMWISPLMLEILTLIVCASIVRI